MINIKELMEEKITEFYNKGNIQADDMPNLFKEIEENFADDKDTKMKFYNTRTCKFCFGVVHYPYIFGRR